MENNEEYEGSDDFREENEQLPAIRGEYNWSIPPLHDGSVVAHATQSPSIDASNSSTATSENIDNGNRLIEEETVNAKPYHCRFCKKRFFKSQALGGHMNRHRQEREDEEIHRARQLLLNKFQMASVNTGSQASPPQVQQQFTGIPRPSSFAAPTLVQSQFTATQAQQGLYNQTPSSMRWNRGYQQSSSCGSMADMSASGCYAKTEDWPSSNLQGRSVHANTMNITHASQECHQVEMMAMRNYEGNQELQHQPHHQSQPQPHHQPQHLPKEANAAYFAGFETYPYAVKQGTSSSSSTTIPVTEQSFNRVFQNPNHALMFGNSDPSGGLIPHSSISATGHHFDLLSSISAGNELLYSDPSLRSLQYMQYRSNQKSTDTLNSIVNDDFSGALAPVGIFTGLAQHSQSQINAVAGEMHGGSNIINADSSPNRD